jgi:hypothetical protein
MPLAIVVSALTLAVVALPFVFDEPTARLIVKWWTWCELALWSFGAFAAARNLPALGTTEPRYTPAAAAGLLLIPVANIYFMHQIATALWLESQPRQELPRRRGINLSARAVNICWLVPLVGFVFLCARPALSRALGGPDWLGLGWGLTLTWGVAAACRVAFVVVVLGIAARQREQWLDLERRRSVPQPNADALR